MSSDRPNQTLADYVALAIGPALIMGLVASLVYFLINVLYVGEFVERLRWILFFFVFGAVLIARMTMRDDTSSRATLYGVPLGILTWLGMQIFVEYPEGGGVRELGGIINAGLIGLVWWCAHRLTRDCTNIDEETDIDAQGLLQASGLEQEAQSAAPPDEQKRPQPEGWLQRWRRYREERKKKRMLGVWVVYFSLAALPLFGLGQALIPAEDLERRQTSFWLMIVYVGCGLGLLLTTCFLSLRRYLRQRRLQMPAAMTSIWLLSGGLLIAALLVVGAVLPRPEAEYSLFSLSPSKSPKRNASKYAVKKDRPGKGEGQPGADDPENKKDTADSGGKNGEQKGERGDATKQGKDGSAGNNSKSSKGQNSGKGQNSRNSGKKQDKGNPSSGQDKESAKDNSKKAQGDSDKSDEQNNEQKSDKESSEKTSTPTHSTSKSSPSALRDVISKVAPVLKWIVFAVLAAAVLFFVLRSGLQFLANFSDWARCLLDALRNFWANLFGGRTREREQEQEIEQEEQKLRERPFASFSNPFAGGKSGMALPLLIRYTFAAAQAWARERDLGRQPGETPLEFANRVGAEAPALEADLQRLAALYARAVYSRGGLPSNSLEALRQFWQRLEVVAEQPLSA
jgi:hypothetical protein